MPKSPKVYGETKQTGAFKQIDGINCEVVKIHFPVDAVDGKWQWYDAYRFTAPGWDECTIVGLAAAKRVIRGRTDPTVLNTMGINPHNNEESVKCREQPTLTHVENSDAPKGSLLGELNERQDLINNSASQLIGLDISEARKMLGYWWVLENQHVSSYGSQYTFGRAGVGKITLYTNEKNIVVQTPTSSIWSDKRKAQPENKKHLPQHRTKGSLLGELHERKDDMAKRDATRAGQENKPSTRKRSGQEQGD